MKPIKVILLGQGVEGKTLELRGKTYYLDGRKVEWPCSEAFDAAIVRDEDDIRLCVLMDYIISGPTDCKLEPVEHFANAVRREWEWGENE